MKITPRLLVVLACAWCGLPLLGIALHPIAYLHFWAKAPLNLAPVLARAAFFAIGWGAYARRGWLRRASMGLAITWTAITTALAVFTPFGAISIALAMRGASSIFRGDAGSAGVDALVSDFWSLLAWSWVVAIVGHLQRQAPVDSVQVPRTLASRDAGENRLVLGGVTLILAWLFAWPYVHDGVSPLREVRPGTWTTDASHAQVVLTDAQRQQASSETLQAVAEINDDITRILTGQAPMHSTRKDYGISSTYTAEPGKAWELTCYTVDGKLSQIDLIFYADPLRKEIGERKFWLR